MPATGLGLEDSCGARWQVLIDQAITFDRRRCSPPNIDARRRAEIAAHTTSSVSPGARHDRIDLIVLALDGDVRDRSRARSIDHDGNELALRHLRALIVRDVVGDVSGGSTPYTIVG